MKKTVEGVNQIRHNYEVRGGARAFDIKEGMTFLLCKNRILFDDNPRGRLFFSRWLENEHKAQETWFSLIKQAEKTHNITVTDKEDRHDKKILKQLKVGKKI